MTISDTTSTEDDKLSYISEPKPYHDQADSATPGGRRNSHSDVLSIGPSISLENERAGFTPFEMDDDVVTRIRTRASVASDAKRVRELYEEYPDGLVRLPLDSPYRALNWPLKRKIWHTMGFGITTLTAQMGASILSASSEQICREFHVGTEVAVLAFSIYVLGNMVGPVFFAPMSELFGRKLGVFIPCFIGGVLMCIAANVNSIAALVVFRFLAGVFCAAPIVSSGGAMADLWAANQRAAALVLYAINIIMGATSAPVFGALLSTTGSYGWRWSQWLSGLLCMTIATINMATMSETFFPVAEQAIVRQQKLDTGCWGLHTEHDQWQLTMREFVNIHLLRPLLMLATPIIFLFVLYASFIYGLVFLLITSVSLEFEQVHHFTHVTGYIPLFAIFVGFLIGGGLNVLQSRRFAKLQDKLGRKPDPEERLYCMMFFGWFIPCGMFLYGWTMKSWIHWFVPCVGLGFVGGGIAIVFQGCLIYMVDVYTKYSASAIAANTMMRSIFGGVFPLFAIQMFKGLGVHWASSLLAFVGLALCPVPWLFRLFGARIRAHDPFKSRLT